VRGSLAHFQHQHTQINIKFIHLQQSDRKSFTAVVCVHGAARRVRQKKKSDDRMKKMHGFLKQLFFDPAERNKTNLGSSQFIY
jgi:hypothetical protein